MTDVKENLLYHDLSADTYVYFEKNENGVYVKHERRSCKVFTTVVGTQIPEKEKERLSLTKDSLETISNMDSLGDKWLAKARQDGVKPSG